MLKDKPFKNLYKNDDDKLLQKFLYHLHRAIEAIDRHPIAALEVDLSLWVRVSGAHPPRQICVSEHAADETRLVVRLLGGPTLIARLLAAGAAIIQWVAAPNARLLISVPLAA